MTEQRCRYDRDTGTYITSDGETCDVPARDHCGARRTCSIHLAWGELTCARCVGRVRVNLRHIGQYAALLDIAALETGRVDTELAMLAGPTCDPEAWSWRKAAAAQGGSWHVSLGDPEAKLAPEDQDDTDPERVLTTWAQMLSEPKKYGGYGLDRPDRWTITNAAEFLDRILHRIAQDENQDFPQMARELKRCRNHLDAALRVRLFVERGVPCPTCVAAGGVDPANVRLVREYPHWCDDPECTRQFHFTTDDADTWVCPRDSDHWWTAGGYAEYLKERRGA